MTNLKRRDFLMITSSMPLLGTIPISTLSASCIGGGTPVAELFEVLKVWLNQETVSPSDYLTEMKIECDDKALVEQMSKADFRAGDTLSVRGIVLSKTEAAILSQLAVTVLL